MYNIEGTTYTSSFARALESTLRCSLSSDQTAKIPRLLAISCFLSPKLQSRIIFVFLIVWAIPRARSFLGRAWWTCGLTVHPCVSFWSMIHKIWKRVVPMNFSHTSQNNRSACTRNWYRCLFSFASSHRRISLEWRRLFHLGCTTMINVLRDDDM